MSRKKAVPATDITTATAGESPTVTGMGELFGQVREVLIHARQVAHRSVNQAMVQAYWQVGRLIVEHEQAGEARAAYGAQVLAQAGRAADGRTGPRLLAGQPAQLQAILYLSISLDEIRYAPSSELSWTHWRMLMRVASPAARAWYTREAVAQTWSTAALDRQISTLHYERLLSSQDKAAVQAEAAELIQRDAPPDPRDFIRDPYVLDFLGAQPGAALYEQDVEQGLLDNLQKFLLELGKGFAFVARQKHLRIEDEDAFVDLVFYNYILKCFVLVELKVGKLSHQDVGQLDMYVRVFDERERQAPATTPPSA
jgi:predicted nuclease of restriction endonuclease-like (RecB) superfamily